jgi:hypothetical protein
VSSRRTLPVKGMDQTPVALNTTAKDLNTQIFRDHRG